MSFKAKLELDGKVITVLNYMIDVDQQAVITGRPTASVVAGEISLSLEMSEYTKELSRWALGDTGTKEGKIIFYHNSLSGILRTITFSKAFCAFYKESYDHDDTQPYVLDVVINAKEIKIGDDEHINNWPMAQ